MRKPAQVWRDVYAIGGPNITSPADCGIYQPASEVKRYIRGYRHQLQATI